MSMEGNNTRPANAARGEASITLDGRTCVLRPSFEALVAAEEELGSLFALVERASSGALTIAEMAGLIWHCLPPDHRPDRAAVGQAVIGMGLVEAARPIRTILAQVLKGGA